MRACARAGAGWACAAIVVAIAAAPAGAAAASASSTRSSAAEPTGAAATVRLETDAVRVLPLREDAARGRIEVKSFMLQGIPVRGAFEVVHVATDGSTRTLAARVPTAAPQGEPSSSLRARAATRIEPAASSSAAIDPVLAAALAAAGATAAPEGPPTLVWRMVLGTPVLAWEVQLRFDPWQGTRTTMWLSTTTGALIDERNLAFASRARVFRENPSETPEPIEVTLVDIDTDEPGVPLVGPRVRSFNCVTVPPAAVEPWHDDGDCWAVQRMVSDGNGDYFAPTPDPIDAASGRDGDDLFAELSMYVHAEHFLERMAQLGLTQYRCELSTMLANFRSLPEADDEGPYRPLDNAYFTDQCDPEKGVTMLFGQGSEVDFAVDADVIYHELGHGTVALLTPEGLTQPAKRSDGVTNDAAAINESIADYVSIMLQHGDPELAEYVGRFWPAQSTPYIRTARNTLRCPDDIVGESHNDGEPLTAALWATRARVGAVMDTIVLDMLVRLPPDARLEDAAAAVLDAAAQAQATGALTADGLALLRRELDSRGLLDCPRVIRDTAGLTEGRTIYLRKRSSSVLPFWPGPVQLRAEVGPGHDALELELQLDARGGDDPPEALLLVKHGDAPIEFRYDLVARDDPGDPSGGSGKVRELTLVSGDWDREIAITSRCGEVCDDGGRWGARIDGLRPGDVVHLGLVASGTIDAVATELAIVSGLAPADADGDTGGSDGDTAPAGEDAVHGYGATASCACTAAARWRGAPWLTFAVLGLARRRRRR